MTTITDVLTFMRTASVDDLRLITEAAASAAKLAAKVQANGLRPGTRVRIRAIRPKYLTGCTGVVADRARRGERVPVTLDAPPIQWRGEPTIDLPPATIEVLA